MSAPFTKNNYPTLARVWFDFHEIFEGDIERTYARDGDNETGEQWQLKEEVKREE